MYNSHPSSHSLPYPPLPSLAPAFPPSPPLPSPPLLSTPLPSPPFPSPPLPSPPSLPPLPSPPLPSPPLPSPPSLPLVTQQIHCPFQPKQSPSF